MVNSPTPGFSPVTAAVYIFNLIVGTGALALPHAFHDAGWLLGSALLLLLAAVSLVTAGWVVEAMAACNGILTVHQVPPPAPILQSISDHKISSDLSEEPREEERTYFDEESEQGDATYLVKTDLAGQVRVGGDWPGGRGELRGGGRRGLALRPHQAARARRHGRPALQRPRPHPLLPVRGGLPAGGPRHLLHRRGQVPQVPSFSTPPGT